MRYPTPSVSAVILNRESKVLLIKHSERGLHPGKWGLPEAALTGGCDWLEGIRNEVRDMVGLVLKSQRLVGIYSDPTFQSFEALEISPATIQHFVDFCFVVKEFEGAVIVNQSSESSDWYRLSDLPSPLVKSAKIKIEDALSFRGKVSVR